MHPADDACSVALEVQHDVMDLSCFILDMTGFHTKCSVDYVTARHAILLIFFILIHLIRHISSVYNWNVTLHFFAVCGQKIMWQSTYFSKNMCQIMFFVKLP
jgi:hypothetical protein